MSEQPQEQITWLEAEQRAEEAQRCADLLYERTRDTRWPKNMGPGADWAIRQLKGESLRYRAVADELARRGR